MNIHYDGTLLTVTLSVTYRGKIIQIADVIVDTGSSHTIFSPDVLERIGVTYENGDPVYEAYGIGGTVPFYTKIMDEITIDTLKINQIEVDVGMLPRAARLRNVSALFATKPPISRFLRNVDALFAQNDHQIGHFGRNSVLTFRNDPRNRDFRSNSASSFR